MTSRPVCPECATPVEVDWEWCHGCGFDPEGKLAEARAQGLEPAFSAAPPATAGVAFPGAAAPVRPDLPMPPTADLPTPPPPPPPAPPAADDDWDDDTWGTELLADAPAGTADGAPIEAGALDAVPASGAAFADLDGWDAPPAPQSSFLDDVPTPAELNGHDPAPSGSAPNGSAPNGSAPNGSAPNGSAPNGSAPSGGFSPTGWQNDPPPERPAGALNPKASGPKTPVLIGIGVAVLLVVGFVFVKMGSNERAKVDTSGGPPPAGAVALNTTPSTITPTTVAAGWVEYRSADGRYVAGFPVAPQQRNVFVVVGDRSLPAVEVNAQEGPAAAAFAVDTIPIPADFPIPDAQTAFDLLAQHFEVTSSGPYSANGLDGVRFTARKDGADLTGLVYVQNGRIFYLAAVGADQESFDKFASSFQLRAGK